MLGSRGSARFVILGLVITASAGACLHAWDDVKADAGGVGGAGGASTTQSSMHPASSTGEGSTEPTTTSTTTSKGGGGAGGSMNTTSTTSTTTTSTTSTSSGATGPCPGGEEAIGEIAVSCAQVNVHGMPGAMWTTDPDCTSGCNVVTVAYCQKFYPTTTKLVTLAAVSPDNKPFFSASCPNPAWDYPGTGQYACCK
jgi:hypothetical protein